MTPALEEDLSVAVLIFIYVVVYDFRKSCFQLIYNLLLRLPFNMLEQTQIQITSSYTCPKCDLKRNTTKKETYLINITV